MIDKTISHHKIIEQTCLPADKFGKALLRLSFVRQGGYVYRLVHRSFSVGKSLNKFIGDIL